MSADQFSREVRKSIILPFRPSLLDDDTFALDIPQFSQLLEKNIDKRFLQRRRGRTQVANNENPAALLGACGEWPRDRRAAEKRDEIAPSHCRAPEASDGGIVAGELRVVKGCPMSALGQKRTSDWRPLTSAIHPTSQLPVGIIEPLPARAGVRITPAHRPVRGRIRR